jgi:hypothetical protein
MIQDRNLKAGTKLVGKYQHKEHTCIVTEKDGKIYFMVDGDATKVFKSPSAAGTAVTGHACDGWHFWSIASEVSFTNIERHIDKAIRAGKLKTPRAIPTYDETVTKIDKMEKAEKPKPPKTGVYRLPNQKGAPAGLTRYYCFDCSSPFPAKSDIKNPACPNCHPAK